MGAVVLIPFNFSQEIVFNHSILILIWLNIIFFLILLIHVFFGKEDDK